MLQSTPQKKAKKATKKAQKRASKAGAEAKDRAAELAERAGEVAHDAADELAERLRESEAIARAQERGAELASLAGKKWRESHLDERAAEIAERVRESDAAKQAGDKTRAYTDATLAAVGGWLASGPAADKLGVEPKRRLPTWLVGLIGVAIGFAAAKLLGGGGQTPAHQEFVESAERLARSSGTAGGTVLADTIRTTLSGDPRTAQLRELNINVAEGTVFVRGTVPDEIDQGAIRDVISGVPGVEDVDLQLTPVA